MTIRDLSGRQKRGRDVQIEINEQAVDLLKGYFVDLSSDTMAAIDASNHIPGEKERLK